MDITVSAYHKGYHFVLTVTDYDYEPAERGSYDTAEYPASAEVIDGYVEYEGDVTALGMEDITNVTKILKDDELFETLCEDNEQRVERTILDTVGSMQDFHAQRCF